jgi:hypothetical protein
MISSSSSNVINFSLRQNKAIERSISFDALLKAKSVIADDPIYVGLGSLWFQDFRLAHRILGVTEMVSIEQSQAIYRRQEFNKPYGSIDLRVGSTFEVIPSLLSDPSLGARPWVVWLDYDQIMDDGRLDELSNLVTSLAPGSALLTTFSCHPTTYARELDQRREALEELFGDVVPTDLTDEDLKSPGLARTLASCVLRYLEAKAIRAGRFSRFVPAIRVTYRDSRLMATVGGLLPAEEQTALAKEIVRKDDWPGFEDAVIETAPLTIREVLALTKLLPRRTNVTAGEVAGLGFELDEQQIQFFERHYGRYPLYAEIV